MTNSFLDYDTQDLGPMGTFPLCPRKTWYGERNRLKKKNTHTSLTPRMR